MTRPVSVPAKQDKDGSVPKSRRAATLKTAVRDRTLPETTQLEAKWNDKTKAWDLQFTDE